jgi:hypothetical protein
MYSVCLDWRKNKRYSILLYSIIFYSIIFYFILFYSIDEPLLAQLRKGENLNIAVSHHQLQQVQYVLPLSVLNIKTVD